MGALEVNSEIETRSSRTLVSAFPRDDNCCITSVQGGIDSGNDKHILESNAVAPASHDSPWRKARSRIDYGRMQSLLMDCYHWFLQTSTTAKTTVTNGRRRSKPRSRQQQHGGRSSTRTLPRRKRPKMLWTSGHESENWRS